MIWISYCIIFDKNDRWLIDHLTYITKQDFCYLRYKSIICKTKIILKLIVWLVGYEDCVEEQMLLPLSHAKSVYVILVQSLFVRPLSMMRSLTGSPTTAEIAGDLWDMEKERRSLAMTREIGVEESQGEKPDISYGYSKSENSLDAVVRDFAGVSARFQNRARPTRHVECICAHSSRCAINGKFRIGDSYQDFSLSLSLSPCSFSAFSSLSFPAFSIFRKAHHWCFATIDHHPMPRSLGVFERFYNAVSFLKTTPRGARSAFHTKPHASLFWAFIVLLEDI